MKILIAEDDRNIREGLRDLLEKEGYSTVLAENGQVAWQYFQSEKPQFVILDIMMPQMDGYAVCCEIRRVDTDVPVIFLSAKSEEIDRVIGLELGADDYISKPFGIREVIARIRAITRRYLKAQPAQQQAEQFALGDVQVFPQELRARRGEQVFDLSLREVKILQLLQQHQGQVVSREQLFNACWGYDYLPNSRTLDQHISRLRKQLETDPSEPQLIKTVHGVGYRYEL